MRVSISSSITVTVKQTRGDVQVEAICGVRGFSLKPDPEENFVLAIELGRALHELTSKLNSSQVEHVLRLVKEGPEQSDDIPL